MNCEVIEKMEDGTRIRVGVSLYIDSYPSKYHYNISVDTCEPKKRTWKPVVNGNLYSYRRLSMEDRRKYSEKKNLEVAGADLINKALTSAWIAVKPDLYPKEIT